MLKKSVIATLLALSASPLLAADYFVVVPVPAHTAGAAKNINVSLASFSLPSALLNTPYAGFDFRTLLSVSGDPAYNGYGVKWSVVSGALPQGLTLNSNGTLSGTPTAAGTSTFQVMASYKTKAGQQAYQVQVASITVGLGAGAPPQAFVGQTYGYDLKQLLSVTGDPAFNGSGVTWSVVASSLPAGLYLTGDGWIGGTPTATGSGSITARASYKGINGQQTYQVVTLNIAVALAAATPPQALVGQAYSYSLASLLTVNGDPAYSPSAVTWSTVASSLPAGLSLGPDGVITGTPTAAGNGSITARAAYRGFDGTQTYQVVSLNIAVGLAAGTLPQAIVGQSYSYSLGSLLTVSGDPAYTFSGVTWTVISNSLPAGLALGSDGRITGVPTAAGTGSITARASYKGVNGQQAYQVVSLDIAVKLASESAPDGTADDTYTLDLKPLLSVTGDSGYQVSAVTWALTNGTLPAGLALDTNTGVISGTPARAATGSSTFGVTATYRNKSGQGMYSLNVAMAPAKPRWGVTTLNLGNASLSGTANTATATLYNDGGLAGNWTTLSNLSGDVRADASACSNVAPSASCVVTFTFKPTSIGTVNLTGITPTSSASRAVNTLAITAAGVQRRLALSPPVGGKSSWNLDTDGPLRLASAGTYTVVPDTSMTISTKLWGGGGGGGGADAAPYYSGIGGGGGYSSGVYTAAKAVVITFNVGGGGGAGLSGSGNGAGAGGWNYGGNGANAGPVGSSGAGGGGGGLTEMLVGGVNVACAGGGGGGGGDGNTATNGGNNGNNNQFGQTATKYGSNAVMRSDDGGGAGGGGGGCNGGYASSYYPSLDSNGEGGAAGYSQAQGIQGGPAVAQPGTGGAPANSGDTDVGTNARGGINATTTGAAAGTPGVVVLR